MVKINLVLLLLTTSLRVASLPTARRSVITENNNLAQVCREATSPDQIINTAAPAPEPTLCCMKMGTNERPLCSKCTLVANVKSLFSPFSLPSYRADNRPHFSKKVAESL